MYTSLSGSMIWNNVPVWFYDWCIATVGMGDMLFTAYATSECYGSDYE